MTPNGFLIESCNSIFDMEPYRTHPVSSVLPFLSKYQSAIKRLNQDGAPFIAEKECLEIEKKHYHIHATVAKHEGQLICVLEERQEDKRDIIDDPVILQAGDNALSDLQQQLMTIKKNKKLRQEYFSKITHDIKLPLTEIVGTCYLLKNYVHEAKGQDYIKGLSEAANSLDKMLMDLLEFSRMESSTLRLESKRFALEQVMWSVVKAFDYKSEQNGIPVSLYIDRGIPQYVKGDPQRLTQVIYNLLDNAMKFTPKGRIDIKINLLEKDAEKCVLEFKVADTGIGIPADHLAQIFDAYHQVQNELGKKGFGLGLSIVKQLIEMQGGQVNVKSEVRQGTSFNFRLPFKIPEQE